MEDSSRFDHLCHAALERIPDNDKFTIKLPLPPINRVDNVTNFKNNGSLVDEGGAINIFDAIEIVNKSFFDDTVKNLEAIFQEPNILIVLKYIYNKIKVI